MTWTKRQLIEQAFGEVGLSNYTFDLNADEYMSALRQLDSLMATWGARGATLGYPLSLNPEGSTLDEESGVPDWAVEAIYSNLALRIGSKHGKQLQMELKATARDAYNVMLNKLSKPEQRQLPQQLPRGAGNKTALNDRPFMNKPDDPLLAGDDGPIKFN